MNIFISIVLCLGLLPILFFALIGVLLVYTEKQEESRFSFQTISTAIISLLLFILYIVAIVLWFVFYF